MRGGLQGRGGAPIAASQASLSLADLALVASPTRASNGGTSYTHGTRWWCTSARQCLGARFYWITSGSDSLRISLWDNLGNRVAFIDVTVTSTGVHNASFAAAQAIAANTLFTMSMHDNAGGAGAQVYYQISGVTGIAIPTKPPIFGLYTAIQATSFYAGTGDAYPTTDPNAGTFNYVTPIQPILDVG